MPSSSSQSADLRLKLIWLTVFRTVATTLMLGAIAVRLLSREPPAAPSAEDSFSFTIIGLVYLGTLAYGVLLRLERVGRAMAYAQVLGDVVLATALVYLTGAVESPFAFTYLLAVVASSILLYQRGALIAAVSSAIAFSGVSTAVHLGWLRSPSGFEPVSNARFAFDLGSNLLAQFLIAALAGFLSRQLWKAGGRLNEREADFKELAGLQQQILESMPSGLMTSDAAGNVTFVNPAGRSILGLPEGDSSPKPLEGLIPGVLRLPQQRRSELEVHTSAGTRTLGLTVTALEHQSGKSLIVFQDLTDLRRMESEVRRIDRLAALGTLAAQLAHEIRNPLAAMRGSAQMLASDGGDPRSSAKLANILVRESDRLCALVEDFLRFARPPPPSLRPYSLKALVAETLEMLTADPLALGVEIDTDLQDLSADVDPDQLRQVLINLLRNAFEAVEHHGKVRVQVAGAAHPEIRIWDSAGSIPVADLERIFQPFYSTREAGTGLGLSTAHSIVRAHGGLIQVTSSPESGTEFVIGLARPGEVAVANPGRR